MKKSVIVGAIIILSFLIMVIVNGPINYGFYETYVVDKNDSSIFTIRGDSYEDVKAYYEQTEIPGGVIYTDISERKMKKINIGQKVRVFSSKTINASSPSKVRAIFVQILENK